MSLLHATWLPVVPAGSFAKGKAPTAGLLIWADTWRVAEPVSPALEAPLHPLSLDIDTLATLPDREYISGLAEVVKYGMILDASFFAWLEAHAGDLLARDPRSVGSAVERSARLKAQVVEQDEREITGLRAALNYGHTFGHAYETAAGYGTLLHGEAVAIGMARAARLAALLGRLDASVVTRQDTLLTNLRLPTDPAAAGAIAPATLIAIMGRDKKSLHGRLRFVLPDAIGRVELVDGVDPAAVERVLAAP